MVLVLPLPWLLTHSRNTPLAFLLLGYWSQVRGAVFGTSLNLIDTDTVVGTSIFARCVLLQVVHSHCIRSYCSLEDW